MKTSSENNSANDKAMEEFIASLSQILSTNKGLRLKKDVMSYRYDSPEQAEEAFRLSRESVERKPFVAPKVHVSTVIEKPISHVKGVR